MSQSPNLIAECAPKRGNDPPAQGTALGNKGNKTDGALTGQKRYRWGNAFAPPGRNHHTAYNTQDVALGYLVVGLSDRHSTVVYSLIGCYEENDCLSAFPSIATRHKICHPFGVPLMDVCLAGVPCFALHRLPVFFHAFGIILFEMQTELI